MDNKEQLYIRPAVAEDTEAMMSLIRELALFEKAPDEVTVSLEHFRQSGFGPNPVWWALVAVSPASEGKMEEIAGLALYYIRYSTWKGQRMYLEDIIVREGSRGKGIGGLLMDGLIEIARKQKFSGMMWQVLEWNEPAIAFYKKYNASFDKEWINVSLEL
jgi:ribosomal protein S18 acetylase RimI-like enzyme